MNPPAPPAHILAHYFSTPDKVQVSPLGEGNINDTFLARTTERAIVLQRINAQVFPHPRRLIRNLQLISRHLRSKPEAKGQRWEDAELLPTLEGNSSVQDVKSGLWRALFYIGNSFSVSKVHTARQAAQSGWALGHFHKKLAGLDAHTLQIPLPGFHILSSYLKAYDTLGLPATGPMKTQFCHKVIADNRDAALSLEQAAAKGSIAQRIIHGDPKVGNILFDRKTEKAVSIIDPDTIGPGLLQHDIGDCLRSICNKAGEKDRSGSAEFDLDLCKITLEGYFQEGGELLTGIDREYIYDGILAITFELGLRFFTDYLQGNIYFKCKDPEETLNKARVQLSLCLDIKHKETRIRHIISTLKTGSH